MRRAFTLWDGLLVAALLAANAALLFRPTATAREVELLSAEGRQAVGLSPGRRVEVRGPLGVTVVELDPRRGARVVSSPCPNRVCVRSGWATPGNPIVACLPNRVAVRVLGSSAGRQGVDAVAR